jgi:Family of unknown function (DUF5995)
MFPYDSTLLTAAQSVPASVSDVLLVMRTIDQTCADGDGLKWFNWLYLEVTEAVEARIVAGGFSDPAWLAELDVQFARLYFSALASSLSGQSAPDCWDALFQSRGQLKIARIQFAMAGINAHINHDLAEALVATCTTTGTTPDHGGVLYTDYTALNTTLDSLIETAKQTLHVRLLGDALPPAAQLENTLAAWSVSAARESAWRNAEILWHLRAEPDLSSAFMGSLDGLTAVAGKALLVPVP